MRTTVLSYLDDFTARGNAIAFAQRRGLRTARWSYEQIARTAYQFARELEARSIQKSDRLLLWAENSPEWIVSFLGCALRGAIVVPLDVQSDPEFVARVQAQVDARLLICDATTRTCGHLNIPRLDLDDLHSLLARHSEDTYCPKSIEPDDDLEIVFTSGTTAEPKGVRLSHRNLLANLIPLEKKIRPYLKWERLVHPVRFLNLVPLSHVLGQFMGIFVPQLFGGEVVLQTSLNPWQIVETIRRERISVVVAVPRVLESLREHVEREYEALGKLRQFKQDLKTNGARHFTWRWWKFRRAHRMFGWKFWAFVSGGATLNAETEEFWRRLGFAVIQGYGMTETAALISVNHPFKSTNRSIGKTLPGQELMLAKDGEILVRGENVSAGYWNESPGADAAAGWFATGDLGEVDEQGNLYFRGRRKEVIVTSAGVNIHPQDLELVLDRQPEVKASAVIETESAHGPEPLAVLILRDAQSNPDVIINRTNESLAPQQQLRRWFIWTGEDFPRTGTQKIQKRLVAEKVRAELAGAVPSPANNRAGSLAEIVRRISTAASGKLDPSAQLGIDLKLDSLGRVELLSALEEHYQVEIDEAGFTGATTLGDVERIVREGSADEAVSYPYPRWASRWPATWIRIALLYLIVFPAIRILGWPKVQGKQHLRTLHGPVVIVCNHVTLVDHALVLLALPFRLKTKIAIAQDGEILRQWRHSTDETGGLRRLINLLQYFSVALFFNVFSMPQKSGFRRSFAFAGELMDRGYNLMVFPEGERTKHGAMNPFKSGAGILIKELGAPVVPMRIHGLWRLKQAHRHIASPGRVSVAIGAAVNYSAEDNPEEIAHDLFRRVKEL